MAEAIVYRPMNPGEEEAVCGLVARVFGEFVGQGYSEEGRQEFLKYVQPDILLARSAAGHVILLAIVDGENVGMIEMRGPDHVSLLFVEPRHHRRGIARGLLQHVLDLSLHDKPDLREVSVNSSPYAVPAYERLGFRCIGPSEVKNGIEFVPMVLDVTRCS